MASFFNSFRSSLMPKQLLRFALSRLDLLDAQALDLENLDFALGRNTVLEFRDVGIILPKLERLLGLPPNFSIQKAKVLVLRVTIPMDFYTSPITAEIDGVDVRLKVASKEERNQEQARKRRKARGEDVVPTAADLAQSFLETQPLSQKKELEEALAAETQDLGASVTSSESESDDDLAYGTGQALTLPAFLTDFLQGVIDRVQVRIRGVSFQIDMEVPVDPSTPTPELVTFQLSLESVNVEGVTSPSEDEGADPVAHKEGKRHILLDNIRAFLISEANVFSTFARSPSMHSSVASRSPSVTESASFSRPYPPASLDGSVLSTGSDDLAKSQYPLRDSEDAFNIPYDLSSNDDDEPPGDLEPPSSLSTPRASIYQDTSPPTLKHHAQSHIVEPEPAPWADVEPEPQSHSEPFLRRPRSSTAFRTASPGESVHSGSASNGSSGPIPEDLTQSHLYSHEDAESMYMSAFSQAESERMRSSMPGAWDAEEGFEARQPYPPLDAAASSPPSPLAQPSHQTLAASHRPHSDILTGNNPPEAAGIRPATPIEATASDSAESEEANEEGPRAEPELQHDDIATPRGPTRLVKEILSMNAISVYIPTNHQHIYVHASELERSAHPNLPGAFSVYSAAPSSPGLAPFKEPTPVETPDKSIEINLKPTEIRFDASIGFLLAMVISQLLDAFRAEPSDTSESSTPKATSATPDIKVTLEELSLNFLEKLVGVADNPERILGGRAVDFNSDTLLKAHLVNLMGSVSNSGSQSEADLSVEKFTFGYANDDIISFDRQVQMFESVASTFPTAGHDVAIKVSTSADTSRVEVNTLPLHVKLDLQRLDETFSWFGGLSSFLNMGSSVASNSPKSPKIPVKTIQKPRGVRFEAPVNPNDKTAAKESKTDLRINGLLVDVIGKECSVLLNTSALKLINREEAVGIHFSRIRLAGPYLRNSRAEAPVIVEVADTRIEYVFVPRNKDLERLLELITPSKVKFDENEDEIMVDTLLRQRKKGSVLCLTVGRVKVDAWNLQQLTCLPSLAEDLAKLGTVAKYLPEDDRPGLLTLGQIKSVDCVVEIGGRFGAIQASLKDLELAHITVPALVAVAVSTISVTRNKIEELVGTPAFSIPGSLQRPPVIMMRMIDDIEPVVKIKLMGLNVEYRVLTVMDVLGLAADATPQDFEDSLAASVADLGAHAHMAIKGTPTAPESADQSRASKSIKIDMAFRDCLIGLNPLGLTSKLLVVLTDAHLDVIPGERETVDVTASLKRASVLLIDDVSLLDSEEGDYVSTRQAQVAPSPQITELCAKGYVNVCQISSAQAKVKVIKDDDGEAHIDIHVRDDLLVLETCADSTQTLISLANALKPPTPPSKEIKYRTSVVPVEDLLASITADAFGKAEGVYDFDNDFAIAQELGGDEGSDDDFYGDVDSPLQLDSQYYEGAVHEELFDATSSSLLVGNTRMKDTNDGVVLSTTSFGTDSASDDLIVEDNHFQQRAAKGTAHRWNSKKNVYDHSNDLKVQQSPLKVCIRDVHVIWNLFDGYDWARTREVITKAVQDVEAKAHERRARIDRRGAYEQDFEEEETVIGDFLFNSIYIGIPANRDPRELTRAINQELHDNTATETESIATTAYSNMTARTAGQHRSKSKSLKLNRSKRHKITFELKGVNADLVTFPPGSGETLNSIDVRIHDVDVFDHVATSTWKKFAMYDLDAGERELGASMVHLELLNTKPVPSMPASEIVLKVTVLPLRLHVDQDALDFITRFFEFKDDSAPIHASPSDIPFIQRAEVNDIPVKLDFKPHRVDYAGLRSGHTTEFMNFVILEESRLVLRHVILYGVSGFDRLGEQLNDIWTDNVKRTQLPGVLAGLAPVRSLVNAGSGFKELIEIPIREYRDGGHIVRGIGRGAAAFAKTTGTEVVKLGAKLAIGTQYALQGAEGLLVSNPHGEGTSAGGGDDREEDGFQEEKKQISLYADQPLGIVQGVRSAYKSLARDLSIARDAIIAVPAEVMESDNAQGVAKAVLKRAPTIIFRPAIGATKAIGQTLLGATNSLDPQNRRRIEAVRIPTQRNLR
ncbi:autophagy-related protein 2 [Podospora aff. communis PSN243]|uniref:Autophagy-related protein 2 n=1 Tax=Podospora aff. communis PSN243 TaxID=3040156 RepID=A0AAV9GLG9_9PEZI|nr:autophagy-related protein 2 [Podospora aff. communis PSN243]